MRANDGLAEIDPLQTWAFGERINSLGPVSLIATCLRSTELSPSSACLRLRSATQLRRPSGGLCTSVDRSKLPTWEHRATFDERRLVKPADCEMLPDMEPRRAMRILATFAACLFLGVSFPAAASQVERQSHGDVVLYQTVAHKIAQGEDYYSAVDELYRARHYPTRPFFAVRPPLLAWIEALVGDAAMPWLGLLASLVVAGAWLWRLRSDTVVVRILAVSAVLATALPFAFSPFVFVHDFWCGMAVSCALACPGPRGRAALGLLAVCFRELSLPFLWVLVAFEKDRKPSLAASGVAIALLALHALNVHPGGFPSQGWLGLRGPAAAMGDMVEVTVLQFAPHTLALVICALPLLGWIERRIALVWFVGFWAVIAVAARADNFYWALNLLPAWFVGYSLLASRVGRLLRKKAESGAISIRGEAEERVVS